MTERGLPIVGGAPACPFVAFADDRDERATSPDHRHRCYAEAEPAPRALAHQEAYCLSSAFPVCPTFQDWARREAAKARPVEPPIGEGPIDESDDDADVAPLVADHPPRRSGHQWSAPPPWLSGQPGQATGASDRPQIDARPAGAGAGPPAGGAGAGAAAGAAGLAAGGLAGSLADRLASQPGMPDARPEPDWEERDASDEPHGSAPASAMPPGAPSRRREHERIEAARELEPPERDAYAPSWERPRRLEAYPTLRSRGFSAMVLSPLLVALVAILLAAAALFFLPSLLGMFGGPSGSPTPAPSVTPGPSLVAEPTIAPAETPQTYTVVSGDTLGKIAKRFGVTLEALQSANGITNPDKIAIGQVLIIPTPTPSELPGASTTP